MTPGNFIFRTREFEQMEMEYFVRPGEDETSHQEWIDGCFEWFTRLGISAENLRLYEQPKEELAHYAKRTVDIQYRFFPEREEDERQWDELMGIANRTDFDLRTHSKTGRRGREKTKPGLNRRSLVFRRGYKGTVLSLCD